MGSALTCDAPANDLHREWSPMSAPQVLAPIVQERHLREQRL